MVITNLSSYRENVKLNSVDFEISTSCENAIRLFNDLFREGSYDGILTYFAFCGLYLDTPRANKVVLVIKNKGITHMWVKRKD